MTHWAPPRTWVGHSPSGLGPLWGQSPALWVFPSSLNNYWAEPSLRSSGQRVQNFFLRIGTFRFQYQFCHFLEIARLGCLFVLNGDNCSVYEGQMCVNCFRCVPPPSERSTNVSHYFPLAECAWMRLLFVSGTDPSPSASWDCWELDAGSGAGLSSPSSPAVKVL